MPRIARRVVCGLSLVMATFSPTRAFVSVDLPTFGRPTNVTKPDLPSTAASHDRSPFFETRTSPVRGGTTRISPVRGERPTAVSAASSCLAAFDEHRRDPATAPAGRAAGHDEAAVLGRRARLRHAAESLAEKPADRVDVLVVEFDAEQVADFVEPEARADPVAARLELGDLVRARIVLVGDLADQLFDEVLERDEARDAAVLVDDEADVHGVALHLLQQRLGLHRLRHEHRGSRDPADRRVAPTRLVAEAELHEILQVEDADDVVGVVVDDRDARDRPSRGRSPSPRGSMPRHPPSPCRCAGPSPRGRTCR